MLNSRERLIALSSRKSSEVAKHASQPSTLLVRSVSLLTHMEAKASPLEEIMWT